jgi:hypothetical protein
MEQQVEMMKTYLKYGIIVMLLFTLVPLASATHQTTERNNTPFQTFRNCYVTMEGNLTVHDYPCFIGTHMYKIRFLRPDTADPTYATIFYWLMRIASDAKLTVYTEQNGEVLYQHQGTLDPEIRILAFKGTYYWDDCMHIGGTAQLVVLRERLGY